jgi:lipopolysaccharide/colanic/teichoic acid biosynthesis glycosyltransferase
MLAPKRRSTDLYQNAMKRSVDVALSLLLIVFLMPLIVLTAILVRWNLGSPILFRQERAGKHGRIFTLLKFRSMRDATDTSSKPLSDSERLTDFGKTIRKLSLDELPQLANVLLGDMSLVGPRPLLVDYLPRYDSHQARRHEVRPGITGLAQVKGRNSLSWPEKFTLDIEYVDRRSLGLDIQILIATLGRLINPKGISAEGQATMAEFLGNPETHETETGSY